MLPFWFANITTKDHPEKKHYEFLKFEKYRRAISQILFIKSRQMVKGNFFM